MKAATLQLATEEVACIFDCISLENNKKFKDFLLKFFADENIEKIGHSFGGDISALNKTFDISLVNILELTKRLSIT